MSELKYTAEQEAILTARGVPVAVDAGAGCGKTFVLTERFLSHLDPAWGDAAPIELDELVAITFTDAAAREMRDRIRKKCRERLAGAGEEHRPFWRRLLRSLDGARVSTIHAFASGLVRDHAIELGVDPAFAVLEPAEGEVLLTTAVDDALRERLKPIDGRLDEDLIDAAAEFDVGGLRSHVRAMAGHAHRPEFRGWLRRGADELVARWLKFYTQHVAPKYAEQFLAAPEVRRLLELMTEATPVKPGFAERLADLSDALGALETATDPDAAIKRLEPLLYFRDPDTRKDVCGVKDWPSKEQKQEFSAVLKALRAKLDRQRRAGDPESMLRAAELGLHVQRLAADAARRYRDAKRRRGVLDNDDLLIEAHRLLTGSAYADAQRRVAERVKVLLVDEFQDTDRLQADLVQSIAGEEVELGRSFLVGDFKQSIYRFRGAEPSVFRERREQTPEAGRLTLSQNFRSTPAVLDFVNTLFSPIFGAAYAPLTPSRAQVAERPAVEFLWTPIPEDAPDVVAKRRAEAASIAGRLRELIDSGQPVLADGGVRPGDVAILFRSLGNVPLYEEALREAGLDYYLVGGHAFYAQQEVFDVLNLLRSILSGCDDIALAGVLRSPMFGLTDEALYWLARRGSLGAGLFGGKPPAELDADARRTVEQARRVLRKLRRQKDRLPAAELLRLAWDETGYDATLVAEFLGERKLANLEKLHEQARQADASGSGLRGLAARLTEFINQPPKEALAATTAGDADVVRLMTVHASKGLEFPVVVLADLNADTQANRTQATFDPRLGPLVKPPTSNPADARSAPPVGLDFWRAVESVEDDAERDRLFYVACTRAADRLILSGSLDEEAKLEGPWLKRLAERFDLFSADLIEGGPTLATVTVPTTAEAVKREASRSMKRLGEAIDRARTGLADANTLADAAPIAVDPADLMTFSVSRLNGKIRSGPAGDFANAEATTERIDPRRLGTLVHAVLERIDPAAESPEKAIRDLAFALAPQHLRRAVNDGAGEAERLARRFLATPEWAAMRGAERLDREVEFLLQWPPSGSQGPTAKLRGYLDALYRDAEGWHVVDYKTNAIAAAEVAKTAEGYALQMAVYAHAVEQTTGAPPASLTLAFLAPGVSHRVAWDAAARAASIDLFNAAIEEARAGTS